MSLGEAPVTPPSVVFMFPGQGAQYVGMARGLYRRFATFRAELDRCAEILAAENIDLIGVLYGPGDQLAVGTFGAHRRRATGHLFGVLRPRPALAKLGSER